MSPGEPRHGESRRATGASFNANILEGKPGETLGRYELLTPLARGGMAIVWAARLKGSRGFEKVLAIKTMLPGMSENASFEQMFLDEAKLASRIRSPHVVEILDLGEEQRVLYIVMEWVDGEPLNEVMREASRRGGMPLDVGASIVMQACAGLHAAHELRSEDGAPLELVHRDISPHNIMVGFDGIARISDFGIAKAMALGGSATEVGEVKGKTAYMSPEQAVGAPLDRRSDVFALGIVLYQLTTGTHPFRGQSDGETIASIVLPDPPPLPSAIVPGFPPEVEAVIMKALSKPQEDRYPSANALMEALGAAVPGARGGLGYATVGAFVESLHGDRRAERREKIKEAIAAAEARALTADAASPVAPERSPRPARGRLLVAGTVALCAAAAVAFLALRSGGSPAGNGASAVSSTPPVVAPMASSPQPTSGRLPGGDAGAPEPVANVAAPAAKGSTKRSRASGTSHTAGARTTSTATKPVATTTQVSSPRISPVRSPGF